MTTAPANAPQLEYPNAIRRLGAFLIEGLIYWTIYWTLALFLGFFLGLHWFLILIIAAVIYAAYNAASLARYSANLGHIVVGAAVAAQAHGMPLTTGRAIARAATEAIGGVIPFITLINGMFVLFRSDRRHIYDFIVGTVVIRKGAPAPNAQV